MRSIKIMGLCLVAVFVMSAVVAATASATKPEFRFSGTKKVFSSVSGEGELLTIEKHKILCSSDRDTGEVEGASGTDKVTNVVITFSGCRLIVEAGEVKCHSKSQAEGVIITNALEGQLGYIPPAANKKVGLVLKSKSELFAEFECLTTKVKVRGKERGTSGERGGVIGEITPVNSLVAVGSFLTLTYTQSGGVQGIRELEVLGTVIKELLLETKIAGVAEWEESGIQTIDKVYALESLEVSA